MAVFPDLLERCAFAKSGHIRVTVAFPTPVVVCVGNPGDVLVCELALGPAHHAAKLACVHEQDIASPRSKLAASPILSEEPQARWNLSRVEELAGKATMQSTKSASIRFFRISPSPDWFDDIEPFASTNPATPPGAK